MCPRVPAGRRPLVLQALQALLTMLLAPPRLWAFEYDRCTWRFALIKFERVGENGASDRFFHQEPVDTVDRVFRKLVDAPIDLEEKYLGFPYFLKINYSCEGAPSEALIRQGHLTGLKPMVLVSFRSPVNYRRWKIEKLQIQMEAAPLRSRDACSAEDVCSMSWYTPMPIKNGSVVMHVEVRSNGLGTIIPPKRFHMNINGFLKMYEDGTIHFTVGNEVRTRAVGKREGWLAAAACTSGRALTAIPLHTMVPRYFAKAPSRPLWHTVNQAPVLILGGIPDEKSVLLTDTYFEDFSLVELSIDSCWVGSFYCPQTSFAATIHDTIATESTLFIRQNQLVYYFTGTYSILQEDTGSGSWVRVLATECIKKLCPVELQSNGSEYVMALTAGKNEGYVHFGTITDGRVSFEMLPRQRSVCKMLQEECSIIWAVFRGTHKGLLLLVEKRDLSSSVRKNYLVISYNLATEELSVLYEIPQFVPDAGGLKFLMLQKAEAYTQTRLVPKGMFYNPFNHLLFIWGNCLLESYDQENYIYLVDFPKDSTVKYVVNSFHGDLVLVTETEEIWYLLEGSYDVYRLFPSEAWDMLVSLQAMQQSPLYTSRETMITVFFEQNKLYQLVYLLKGQNSQVVKRLVPVEQLLVYMQLKNSWVLKQDGSYMTPILANSCPFESMRLQDLPNPQRFTRQERYRARPPRVVEHLGFHSKDSLAVYQGLVYYLLLLHSKYDKPYADPVHDPTWRWWKNKKQDQSYYFYLASNSQSANGVYIEMESYEKVYNVKAEAELPERIFLDKGSIYTFSVLLTAQGQAFKIQPVLGAASLLETQLGLGVVLAEPGCLEVSVSQSILTNRNSVFFRVTVIDRRVCFDQGISGHHLKKTAILVKVVGAAGHCFQNTYQGPRMQGNLMVPVLIGCPPGKRLAFDITFTVNFNRLVNKHYFDCVQVDPEMPCFLFSDILYPFFLIQDLVTGESGRFQGRYTLQVVGGGPTLNTIKDYSEEEIDRYNNPLDKTQSLIWSARYRTASDNSTHSVKRGRRLGIEWLCLENSPCHDVVPRSIFAPDFFFKVLVSNRDVDKTTYCAYQLVFVLHIHGLPLSSRQSLFFLVVSASILVSLVVLYLLVGFLWPLVVKGCSVLRWKVNNLLSPESFCSYASSSRVFSMPSIAASRMSSKIPSRVPSRVPSKMLSRATSKILPSVPSGGPPQDSLSAPSPGPFS